MAMDKKGVSPTILILPFAFFFFFIVLGLGIWLFGVTQLDSAFTNIDLQIGNVSFNDTYAQTMKPSLDIAQSQADTLGLILLFGMIIILVIIGFFTTGNRMWIVYDVFVIIFTFIVAVNLAIGFNEYISNIPLLNTIHADLLPKSSSLLLNLPYLIVIAGALIVIVTYGITKKKKAEPNVYGQF